MYKEIYIGNKQIVSTIPTKISQLTNDLAVVSASDVSTGPGSGNRAPISADAVWQYSCIKRSTASSSSITLNPGYYYVFGTMSSLTVTLNAGTGQWSNYAREYHFIFKSSSTGTSLTLPSSLKYVDGIVPEIEANATYEVSILENLCCITKFA